MRIRPDALQLEGKAYYWVEEHWPGFSPSHTYIEQAAILRRRRDSISYVESAWEEGKVVMLFDLPDKAGFIQLVCVDSAEDLVGYLRGNEAFSMLPPECRKVTRMVHWDAAKDAFLTMIARLHVRAKYEAAGEMQPTEAALMAEAAKSIDNGTMAGLFGRLS